MMKTIKEGVFVNIKPHEVIIINLDESWKYAAAGFANLEYTSALVFNLKQM